MKQDEYGVYRDEEGNARANDGKITDVSKENIEAILERDDSAGCHYMSLP